MATFKVYVDGQYTTFTSAEYEAKFGYKPTSPREGERLFGGRYEHSTFVSGSEDGKNQASEVWYNQGNSATSSKAGGY